MNAFSRAQSDLLSRDVRVEQQGGKRHCRVGEKDEDLDFCQPQMHGKVERKAACQAPIVPEMAHKREGISPPCETPRTLGF